MNRRDFLRTAGGAAGGTAAVSAGAGTAVAQEGNASSGNATSGNETGGGGGGSAPTGPPDLGGYLDGANNYSGSVADKTGQSEVTVEVGAGDGGLAFGPAAVHVDNGATVKFEWTGEGGAHNVVAEDGSFESGSPTASAGVNFEHTFNSDGVYNYYCNPHKASGMLGSIVVGTDYPTKAASSGGGGHQANTDPTHMGVPFQAHWVGIATILMMFVSLIFTFFLLKYGESPHTKGGND
ncbi:halocyanin domain-containing protein [Halorientalis brevis]|uniref:Halocyanin domain-containing protein n=1 Tax=Halorientalis brevis TaxID=1126241 RepID=A0ABD6CFZ5_9EURY|nr:halocyanin domain-containing protein [Halorientalis brevis]